MQKKTTIRQSSRHLFFGCIALLIVTCSNLSGALVEPQTYNAQLTEMRIRTTGHVRLSLKFTPEHSEAREALKIILSSCSTFFATARRPVIFAAACQEVSNDDVRKRKRRVKARRILKEQELLHLTRDPAFRKAVLTYVIKEKMMKKAAVFWEEAELFVERQRNLVASGQLVHDEKSVAAVEKAKITNPFIWALDHVMRLYASRSAVFRIRKNEGK